MKVKLNEYKQLILKKAIYAESNNWINNEFLSSIKNILDSEELVIGIVGKMNIGKSSIINTLIFQDCVLPTSPIPLTATLTNIKYGEHESATVATITQDDFDEICRIKNLTDNTESKEKINAAIDLFDNITKIDNYQNFFGKIKTIELSEFETYIGANGKFSALAKSVTITFPKKELQGITIVDTPGFNDPISSRDDITLTFLSHANVIVLVQDPYQAFDLTDMYLLESQISKAGIGKMIILINKFDLLEMTTWESEIKKREQKKNRIATETTNSTVNKLLNNSKMIHFSNNLAMVGYLKNKSVETLTNNRQLINFYTKFTQRNKNWQDASADEFISISNVKNVENEINKIINQQKMDILINAPLIKLVEHLESSLKNRKGFLEILQDDINKLKEGIPDIDFKRKELETFGEKVVDICAKSKIKIELAETVDSSLQQLIKKRDDYLNDIDNESFPNPKFPNKQQMKRENHESIMHFFFNYNIDIRYSLGKLNRDIKEKLLNEINELINYLNGCLTNNLKNIHGQFLEKLKLKLYEGIPNPIVISTKIPTIEVPSNKELKNTTAVLFYNELFGSSYSDNTLDEYFLLFRKFVDRVGDDFKEAPIDLIGEQKNYFDAANDEIKCKKLIEEKENEFNFLNNNVIKIQSLIEDIQSIKIEKE